MEWWQEEMNVEGTSDLILVTTAFRLKEIFNLDGLMD